MSGKTGTGGVSDDTGTGGVSDETGIEEMTDETSTGGVSDEAGQEEVPGDNTGSEGSGAGAAETAPKEISGEAGRKCKLLKFVLVTYALLMLTLPFLLFSISYGDGGTGGLYCVQYVFSEENKSDRGGIMSYERVKQYFNEHNIPNEILLLDESSATVELAAKALGREPGEIAKSLALKLKDGTVILLVVCGTARIDNRKYKDTFHCKAQMLSYDETLEATGHPVGGVCPFALPEGVRVYIG
jgi:prolyl-tRNA editing enzyme YbaK/EbsC (Cys-tRNA(Pro) deacylase)